MKPEEKKEMIKVIIDVTQKLNDIRSKLEQEEQNQEIPATPTQLHYHSPIKPIQNRKNSF